jgi:hypothetical protein
MVLAMALIGPMGARAADKPGIEFGEVVVVTGKVVAIDRTDRSVAVMGPEGNVLVVEVGKAAKNFNQIKVGDQVKLEYYEAVAIYVAADGKPPAVNAAVVVATAPKGMKPAGEAIEVVDVSATIQAIDTAKRTLTLKGPQGNLIPLKVDKSVKAFDQLKVGDSIHVRYTEAVAITVSKP